MMVFWILALPLVAVFFLTYGVVEDIIKKAWAPKRLVNQPRHYLSNPCSLAGLSTRILRSSGMSPST
jgi:hypothetical protein